MGFRVLIVDDEPLIRRGIKAKIHWQEYGVELVDEAEDGAEAIQKFEIKSYDIVITDIKMPEMDGITLIKELKSRKSTCKFAIISGYAEFEYAKKALTLGVKDYILKPIDPVELEDSVTRMIAYIKEDKERSSIFGSNIAYNDEKIEKVLGSIIYGRANDYSSDISLPVELTSKNFFIVSVLKIRTAECGLFSSPENNTGLFFSIENLINDVTSSDKCVIFIRNYKASDELIFVFGHSTKADISNFARYMMTNVVNEITSSSSLSCAVGLGEEVDGIDSLWQSYYQANYAVCEKMVKGFGRIYSFREIREKSTKISLSEDNKKILRMYMEEGKKTEAFLHIDQIFSDVLKISNLSYTIIRNISEDIYLCIKDHSNMSGHSLNIVLDGKFDFSNQILALDSVAQVKEWIKNIVSIALDNTPKERALSGEDIVQEVKQYINRNYSQDITLGAISQKYHINQNYFCRLFKEVTGKNFNEYLTGIRITKACELMENSTLKISQIADLIGYNEPKYFSKVFKSETGMSPSEYLHMHRSG